MILKSLQQRKKKASQRLLISVNHRANSNTLQQQSTTIKMTLAVFSVSFLLGVLVHATVSHPLLKRKDDNLSQTESVLQNVSASEQLTSARPQVQNIAQVNDSSNDTHVSDVSGNTTTEETSSPPPSSPSSSSSSLSFFLSKTSTSTSPASSRLKRFWRDEGMWRPKSWWRRRW